MKSLIYIERARARKKQSELAEAAGVSRQTIARWERDEIELAPIGRLAIIASTLGCEISDLYE